MDVIITFLALLEMIKINQVELIRKIFDDYNNKKDNVLEEKK